MIKITRTVQAAFRKPETLPAYYDLVRLLGETSEDAIRQYGDWSDKNWNGTLRNMRLKAAQDNDVYWYRMLDD